MFTRSDSFEAGDQRWAQLQILAGYPLNLLLEWEPWDSAPRTQMSVSTHLGTDRYPVPFTKPAGKGRKGLQLKGISFIKIKGKILKQSYVLLNLQT